MKAIWVSAASIFLVITMSDVLAETACSENFSLFEKDSERYSTYFKTETGSYLMQSIYRPRRIASTTPRSGYPDLLSQFHEAGKKEADGNSYLLILSLNRHRESDPYNFRAQHPGWDMTYVPEIELQVSNFKSVHHGLMFMMAVAGALNSEEFNSNILLDKFSTLDLESGKDPIVIEFRKNSGSVNIRIIGKNAATAKEAFSIDAVQGLVNVANKLGYDIPFGSQALTRAFADLSDALPIETAPYRDDLKDPYRDELEDEIK
jgi:hypothetical protein